MTHRSTELLNTKLAARQLSVSPQTLEKWRSQNRGPRFVKVGGTAVRYRSVDLDAFVDGGHHDC
ncbi:Helix-turn-helix domain protein [Flavimaricola marinus]|uniref:Helix-turn-helix domain protein n=2 Tax=Flavimaricola marinus TaxID=1819565 RepID=A0A238LCD8_9RHOB|nr:Helix-turn-helix domain protein [Flavimaricola marinus]